MHQGLVGYGVGNWGVLKNAWKEGRSIHKFVTVRASCRRRKQIAAQILRENIEINKKGSRS